MTKKSSGSKGRRPRTTSEEPVCDEESDDGASQAFEIVSRSADQERFAAEAASYEAADKGEWLPGLPTRHIEQFELAEMGALGEAEFNELGAISLDLAYTDLGAGGMWAERLIGRDDRVPIADPNQFPYHRICHLTFNTPSGGSFVGTGWLAGPKLVVTAGHCVYNRDSRYGVGWATNMKVYPARNGSSKPAVAKAANVFSVREWKDNGQQEADFGAIILDKPLGEEFGWFAFATASDSELQGMKATIAGYPGDKSIGTMWAHANKITQVSKARLSYLMDTWGGQSGSPVIIKSGDEWVSVGIHNYGETNVANYATRINDEVFRTLEKWKAI